MSNAYKSDFQSVLKSTRTCDKAEFETRTSSSRSTAGLLLNSKVVQDLSRSLETWKCEQTCSVRNSYRNRPRNLIVASQLQHDINWKTLFAQEELMADSNMLFKHAVHSTYCQSLHNYFTHRYIQLNNYAKTQMIPQNNSSYPKRGRGWKNNSSKHSVWEKSKS